MLISRLALQTWLQLQLGKLAKRLSIEADATQAYLSVLQIGHAGTLDPMATGLLIICTGKATKSIDSFQAMHKEYSGKQQAGAALAFLCMLLVRVVLSASQHQVSSSYIYSIPSASLLQH